MWKPTQSAAPVHNPVPAPEPIRTISSPGVESVGRPTVVQHSADQAIISKGLIVKGEIAGAESLFVDGKVQGSINLPGERVTVGQNGQVVSSMSANLNVCITAREIIIMGNVSGNVAADRVEIRAGGKLNGDISTCRISIADGAFFKGGIDIRESNEKASANTAASGISSKAFSD
jgi:cytoskeletal protein CcmA (bactofilin family)